jgi:hypothetical protein
MTQIPSRGYSSSARVSNAPGAYIEILQADFGVLGGAAPVLTPSALGGSLATSTARVAVTWITAQGESKASAEATTSVTGPTGSVSIAQPTVPTTVNGNVVLGWRVYSSSGGAGSALLNTAGTVQTQVPFVTSEGVLYGFPIATTTVVLQVYGTGQAEPAVDFSGAQPAMPSVPANSTVDYFFRVPNTGSQWKVFKSVHFMRPEGIADPAGLTFGPLDCTSPEYPGTSATVTAGETSYFVMNNTLFIAIVSGTTAATFIGGAAFRVPNGATVTDGSVTWLSLGKRALVRARWSNVTTGALTPASQEVDIFEL